MTASPPAAPGMPSEEEILRAINVGWRDGDEFDNPAALSAILSLIRPAFEALKEQAHYATGVADLAMQHRDAAEAKLAQAVEDEREACATIAETAADCLMDSTFDGVARAIRARSASAAARGET